MLEYALPKHRYRHLNWPDKSQYPDWGQRMEEIRRRYMINGSFSPISCIGGLLAYGKAVAITEGTIDSILQWLMKLTFLQNVQE